MSSKEEQEMELQIALSVASELPDNKLISAKRFLDKLSDFNRISKLYGTYIEGVKTSLGNTQDGKIYVNYNIDGARTGRLSNSGANTKKTGKETKIGVSFHTLPREQEDFNIRNYVIAPDGYDFITIDMKAAELRVLAHVANEKNMIKAFQSGIDLHDFSTQMTFNKEKSKTPPDEWKKLRQICKEVSFLTVYGGTAYTLANKRRIPEKQAEKIIKAWMNAFPGVQVYMDTIQDYVKQFGYAKTIFGRYRHLPNINSPVKGIARKAFRQGLNFTIQSAASDIILCGILGVREKFKKAGLTSKIVGTVHDSICAITPKNESKQAILLMVDELRNYSYMRDNFSIELKVPLDVDVKIGKSFGDGEDLKI